MNILLIIAMVLTVVSVGAVLSTQRGMRPRCPFCRSYTVSEREDGYICHDCGSRFIE